MECVGGEGGIKLVKRTEGWWGITTEKNKPLDFFSCANLNFHQYLSHNFQPLLMSTVCKIISLNAKTQYCRSLICHFFTQVFEKRFDVFCGSGVATYPYHHYNCCQLSKGKKEACRGTQSCHHLACLKLHVLIPDFWLQSFKATYPQP